ncbi:DUF4189 domain-containing protein [Variovorax sp. DXTD-1]|uniref:DUF4189 domain-containing protein n=1 Tax=Variovorax sp. DXTD-1 TaxID=2495592 RepID=UPI000F864B7E|nr:DUF4189 domain-containing protein [Variovorax sp. DXTD-1]
MSTHLLRRLLTVSLWLLGTGVAYAEGNCPDGYYPIGGRDFAGCAPIPGSGSQRQAPQQPVEQWERRWGAIATSVPDGILGVSTDRSSKREASQTAISDCAAKGGLNCKIETAYDNQCAAVVVGDGAYNAPIAATMDKAVEIGMKTCRDGGLANCHVYYSACSLPVRTR